MKGKTIMAVEATQPVKTQAQSAQAPVVEIKKGEKAQKPAEVTGTTASVDVKAAPAPKAPAESPVASATKAPGVGEKIDVKA